MSLVENTKRFFGFMIERESIRLKKNKGLEWPWTDDPILQRFKFTNVKREHDRTSQLLIKEFYQPNYNAPRDQILLNCALARYVGTIDYMRAIGWQESFKPTFLKRKVRDMMDQGKVVWTAAYIITTGGRAIRKEEAVIDDFIAGVWNRREQLAGIKWTYWKAFLDTLTLSPGFGGSGFMAKEVSLDTRYTSFWPEQPKDRYTWTPIGPGSKRGVGRMMGKIKSTAKGGKDLMATPEETLNMCIDLFKQRKNFLPKNFVPLEVHDIQFQLCEWDKYERVRLGQGRPRSTYSPHKQGTLL